MTLHILPKFGSTAQSELQATEMWVPYFYVQSCADSACATMAPDSYTFRSSSGSSVTLPVLKNIVRLNAGDHLLSFPTQRSEPAITSRAFPSAAQRAGGVTPGTGTGTRHQRPSAVTSIKEPPKKQAKK